MNGKYWSDFLAAGYMVVEGKTYSVSHLRDRVFEVQVEEKPGCFVKIDLQVEFTSHCVSRGPKKGQTIDFSVVGYDQLVIDGRNNWRSFNKDRYALSSLLPNVVETLASRPCLFTNHENFLTLEIGKLLPNYPEGTEYEIYFNARKGSKKNSVRIVLESAYVRDEYADHQPKKFKKNDRIKGGKLLLKKARGLPIKRPPGQ